MQGIRLVEWIVRGGLALLALTLAFASVTQTLARVTARRDVSRAHFLAPTNAQITAALSMQQITDTTTNRRASAAQLAQAALQRDATAVQAVATLGLEAQFAGDSVRARRLFTYAEKLSRRDLPTRLWAIEDAVARNDVPGTLRHYDIALRTAKKAPELLFPVLSAALTDFNLRTGIVRILLQRPPWGGSFIGYAAALGPDPVANALFVINLDSHGIAVSPDILALAVNRLVKGDRVDLAWKMYAALNPNTKPDSVRNSRFTAAVGTPSAFDWQPINDGSISATIQYEETGGVFDFAAPTSVGGALLQQLEVLPPGIYRLEGQSSGITQPEQSLPYWVLTCRDGRELGRVVVPNSDRFGGVFRGQINVPASCPAQTLALIARPSDDISGTAGQINQISLVRAPGHERHGMKLWALTLVGLLITGPAVAQQLDSDATDETEFAERAPATSAAPVTRTADTGNGQIGQRQTRQDTTPSTMPFDRIDNRVSSRVQNRIRNRIDRYYDPQANATSPFTVASDQARRRTPQPR